MITIIQNLMFVKKIITVNNFIIDYEVEICVLF